MNDFAKAILNYFAAFTETRFRFDKKTTFAWTNDQFTLDLAVFPDFQEDLLNAVAAGQRLTIKVAENQYTVCLDAEGLRRRLLEMLDATFSTSYAENCISSARATITESTSERLLIVPPSGSGQTEVAPNPAFEHKVFREGCRQFCVAFRKQMSQVLQEMQQVRLDSLRADFGVQALPPSTLNARREEQRVFDDLIRVTQTATTTEEFHAFCRVYITDCSLTMVMYDLYHVLRGFLMPAMGGNLCVFFHNLAKDQTNFPLFFVECDLHADQDAVRIQALRDVVMLNTPALNYCQYDGVLTTPRASTTESAPHELESIEMFLQRMYQTTGSFMFRPRFTQLLADGLPSIHFRVGLQVVRGEDWNILDYSELITSMEGSAGKKFSDMVGSYVDGNVENTGAATQREFEKRFPRGSATHLVPKDWNVPLPLNRSQKKILAAVESEKNQVIVVDGPPGTGKSYTITALVYHANQAGKCAVITSHKRQALDVIDDMLTEQFKGLHPQSKPSVLRLTSDAATRTANDYGNTLTGPSVNGASRRADNVNRPAIESDRDRAADRVVIKHDQFLHSAELANRDAGQVRELQGLLDGFGLEPNTYLDAWKSEARPDMSSIEELARICGTQKTPISLSQLVFASARRAVFAQAVDDCENLNRLPLTVIKPWVGINLPQPELVAQFSDTISSLRIACRHDVPLKQFDVRKIEAPATAPFDLSSFTDLQSLETWVGDLDRLVKATSGIWSKIFKNSDAKQLEESLSKRARYLFDVIRTAGVSAALPKLVEFLALVHRQCDKAIFVTGDYVLCGIAATPPAKLSQHLDLCTSLKFRPVIDAIVAIAGKPWAELTLDQVMDLLATVENLQQYHAIESRLRPVAVGLGVNIDDVARLFEMLNASKEWLDDLGSSQVELLRALFAYYDPLFARVGISADVVKTIGRLAEPDTVAKNILRTIELHLNLSVIGINRPPARTEIDDFFEKNLKLILHQNDDRFKELRQYSAKMQQIVTCLQSGKRMSQEQAGILLKHLSCLIAEPQLISQHFPMESDMIDLLIIDEASQVSIAESISLILRAKQTVVFGDDLQYGAVSAVNVSERYAGPYFREILRTYAREKNELMSREEEDRITQDVVRARDEEEEETSLPMLVAPGTKEWLKTFSVRTSTLSFARALANYQDSLNVHFRSFPEIISYSNDTFYRPSQIDLTVNRIRTRPIGEVIRFMAVETKGFSGPNTNLDEIEAIRTDIQRLLDNGYKGDLGVICSFKEQTRKMEEELRRQIPRYPDLVRDHKFKVWFVGDVQGEERDLIYYSFVQDKRLDNADLRTIYPVPGGSADNIRRLKMQRLNVGFSRAKDTMVFVHSMPLGEYSDSKLGDALNHYQQVLTAARDHYIGNESVFESPPEKHLYGLITQTDFFRNNSDKLRITAQFEIGKYIRQEYQRYIPNYRVDFLLTFGRDGVDQSLIIEYDGIEFHMKDPASVTAANVAQEYVEYDINRQLELESYGYRFLRINKFTLMPTPDLRTPVAVLNQLLEGSFAT